MNESFLLNFMRMALDTTGVERAFAVDTSLTVLGTVNMLLEEIEASYLKYAHIALEKNQAIITDSYTLSTDPANAPNTNHSIPQIRSVVFVPVENQGVICLDQSVKHGVLPREEVERLTRLAAYMVNRQQTHLDEANMAALYKQVK